MSQRLAELWHKVRRLTGVQIRMSGPNRGIARWSCADCGKDRRDHGRDHPWVGR